MTAKTSWWLQAVRRARTAGGTVLKIVFILGGVSLIWSCSYWIFILASGTPIKLSDPGTLVTVLFGASTIALFILSFLVAVVATLGWQSYKEFREGVGRDIEGMGVKLESIENLLGGRVETVSGYLLGEMSLKPDSFDAGDRDRLEQAVKHCRKGHEYLQKIGIGSPPEMLGLNNRLFYTCVLNGGESHKDDAGYMLSEARRLRDAGQLHDNPTLKLTACRVFLEYGATKKEKKEAQAILRALVTRKKGISERERKEARFYLNKYFPTSVGPFSGSSPVFPNAFDENAHDQTP